VQAGCPKRIVSGSPSFLLSEVIPWRRAQDAKEQRGGASPKEDEERVRKLTADADYSELRVRERLRELVPAADMQRTLERLCAVLRARIVASRGKWSPRIIALGTMAEATAAMDALIADLLEALRDSADELEADEIGEDDDQEAA
jgi:hypothetical protein